MPSTEPHAHIALLALLLAPELVDAASHARIVRRLRASSWRELVLLARSGQPKVHLHLDAEQIERTLRMIRGRLDREDRLDYFIEHGATTAMLRRLFRLPVAQIKARRAQLLGAHRQRRPALPKVAERDAVHRAWWQIRDERRREPPTVDDYLRLQRRFPRYSFATLEAIINEFDD